MQSRPKVVIVGGGVSGLATAHYLHSRLGDHVQLTLLEGGSRLGGKVANQQFSGHLVDTGPDAVLVRAPAMAALLEDLGLGSQIVAPAALGAHVWSRGKLRRLPTGTLFGVPDRLLPLLKSRLMSPAGLARAAMDLVLPHRHTSAPDPSIADLVTPRLGSQVFDRLVEPLLGGVHAGRAAELSAHSTVSDIEALASNNRSLYLGLRKMRRHAPPTTGAPVLVTLTGGLGRLVEALETRLAGDDLRLGATVGSIARVGTRYHVDLTGGQSIAADAVVLATPAFATAGLLAELAPDAAAVLAEIPYVDVATIWLSYPRSAVGRPMDGTGFLVPPEEGKLLVGCTWSSRCWVGYTPVGPPSSALTARCPTSRPSLRTTAACTWAFARCAAMRHRRRAPRCWSPSPVGWAGSSRPWRAGWLAMTFGCTPPRAASRASGPDTA